MQIFEQIRARIHHHLLRKELPRRQVQRSTFFLDNARTIGILFDASELEQKQAVLEFVGRLREQGKRVKLLAYVDRSLKGENQPFSTFSKKDLDWALRPKSSVVTEFLEKPFDLLLTFSQKELLPVEYIAATSKAHFRIGMLSEKTYCYDLIIDTPKEDGLRAFIHQMVFYLKKMQPSPSRDILSPA
ncbi:MAG: hypothetical protein ACE5FF_16675 [Saprospiraceae bacterium]